jgi:hypothetical protein
MTMAVSDEVRKEAAAKLEQALWDWVPRTFTLGRPGAKPNSFWKHFYAWEAGQAHSDGVFITALIALNQAAVDGFEYHEARLRSDFTAVGELVERAVASLRAA